MRPAHCVIGSTPQAKGIQHPASQRRPAAGEETVSEEAMTAMALAGRRTKEKPSAGPAESQSKQLTRRRFAIRGLRSGGKGWTVKLAMSGGSAQC